MDEEESQHTEPSKKSSATRTPPSSINNSNNNSPSGNPATTDKASFSLGSSHDATLERARFVAAQAVAAANLGRPLTATSVGTTARIAEPSIREVLLKNVIIFWNSFTVTDNIVVPLLRM